MGVFSFWTLLVLTAALANCAGALLSVLWGPVSPRQGNRFLGFSAGFILSAVFMEMIPGSLKTGGKSALLMLLGYLFLHVCRDCSILRDTMRPGKILRQAYHPWPGRRRSLG